jgi:hypothetical protein
VSWRCTPTVSGALLEVAGLVDDHHHLVLAQVLDDVFVPHRPGEQVPVGVGVAGVLGDRRAVLS